MIDLYSGELADMLPAHMKNNIETQCISYALKMSAQRIIDSANATRTQSVVDDLSEQILDTLAVELRAPYYLESMTVEQKQEIIKKTLPWHFTAGTVSAVEELVSTVIGEGSVTEWFDFEEGPGDPGTFDIESDARLTPDIYERFDEIIDRAKNARSHIRRLLIKRTIELPEAAGGGFIATPEETAVNSRDQILPSEDGQKVGTGMIAEPEEHALNHSAQILGAGNMQRFAISAFSAAEIST